MNITEALKLALESIDLRLADADPEKIPALRQAWIELRTLLIMKETRS